MANILARFWPPCRSAYFATLYQSINLPGSESLMLLRRDGRVLVRYPTRSNGPGRKCRPTRLGTVRSRWVAATMNSFGVFDTTVRLVAVRPLRDYPLVMDVALTEDSVLAHWRREATLIAFGTAAAAACMLLMLYGCACNSTGWKRPRSRPHRPQRRSDAGRRGLAGSEARPGGDVDGNWRSPWRRCARV